MAKYINRDDLLKAAWGKPTLSLSVYYIGNIKTVDVAPVRHAMWEMYGKNLGECSECGEIVSVRNNYCPNCGAKMDEKDG